MKLAAMLLAALALAPALAHPQLAIVEEFDAGPLDEQRWSLYRMGERHHWIDTRVVRDGAGALAIRIRGSDLDPACQCQISEIREAPDQRLHFGQEAWYAFSFRIDGRGPVTGDQRWQIGGWKQESDGSPFLAQRFDNGIFHVTLESGNSRVLVATSEGEAKSFFAQLKNDILSRFAYVSDPARYDGGDDITMEYGLDPILPDPRRGWVDMVYRVKGGLDHDGIVEVYANGRFIVRATGTIGVFGAEDPSQYFRFGHNRAPMPGTSTIHIDRFRRGASMMDVER
ncbi:MAG TPA: heparin lyase I family protein [Aestuariivirgaceae bacterium]|nr:heparin lyase I family protein [Aestuariivirgaceae bacterium]